MWLEAYASAQAVVVCGHDTGVGPTLEQLALRHGHAPAPAIDWPALRADAARIGANVHKLLRDAGVTYQLQTPMP